MFYATKLSLPRSLSATLGVAALLGAAVFTAPAALAATTETGPDGQELTVSTTSLDPEGTQVTVTGTGYREDVGVYVGLCVIPEAGDAPGPCLGGVNTSGEGESSVWVSSNPPAYAEGLTIPYDAEGSFEVDVTVMANDGHTDCLDPAVAPNGCALSTRADHTRGSDRSADVLIPVTFDGEGAEATQPSEEPEQEDPAEEAPDQAEETDSSEDAATETDDAATDAPGDEADTETSETDGSDGVQNEEDADENGNSTALIIGIAAGVGVIAGVIAVLGANRRKRAANPDNADDAANAGSTNTDSAGEEQK